jgi:hypothetical protein
MPGDLGLDLIQRGRHLADAQLAFGREQSEDPAARRICDDIEDCLAIHDRKICHSIYTARRISELAANQLVVHSMRRRSIDLHQQKRAPKFLRDAIANGLDLIEIKGAAAISPNVLPSPSRTANARGTRP